MKVTVEPNGKVWELWFADNRCRPMPAGPRLFRADPPQILFRHSTREEAQRDAVKLQAYLEIHFAKKQSKTTLRASKIQ